MASLKIGLQKCDPDKDRQIMLH